MTHQSRNVNKEASLELSLASMKSLVSSYVLRASQAEQLAGRLMMEKLNPDQMQMVCALINEQIKNKAYERSVQQQAVLQATLVACNAALQADDDGRKKMLLDIVKDLTRCVEHMDSKPRSPQ
jgi:hypothetical protein